MYGMLDTVCTAYHTCAMNKRKAVELFTTQKALADAVGIEKQSVSDWPDELPPRIADRVIAACWRKGIDPSPLLESEVSEASQ